jgi:hypothetical protein
MYHHLFDFCICSHHRQVDGGATKGVPGELAFSTVLLSRVVSQFVTKVFGTQTQLRPAVSTPLYSLY